MWTLRSLPKLLVLALPWVLGVAPATAAQEAMGAQTWYVDASATPPGDGSAAAPFFSVTYALSRPQVASEDLVLVAPGDYVAEEVDFFGKSVIVESTGGPDVTRLIARPQIIPTDHFPVVRVESGESRAVLRGFELTGGTGALSCSGFTEPVGGAVAVCGGNLRLEDCVFISNAAESGGAVYGADARLEIVDCIFRGPGSDAQGEALHVTGCALLVEGCTFEDLRIAPQALPTGQGAVFVDQSAAVFRGCTFQRNATRLFGAHLWSRSSDVTVESSVFGVATGYAGTSIAVLGGDLRLANCVVADARSVSTPGAGLFASGAGVTIERCLFRDNLVDGHREGGAIAIRSGQLEVVDSIFEGNESDLGGALHVGDQATASVRGSSFAGNVAVRGGGAIAALEGQLFAQETVFRANEVRGSGSGVGPGGAVLGDALLVRCTLAGNIAESAGGAGGTTNLIASIAWGNLPTDLEATCAAARSIVGVPDGASVADTIDGDPLFFSAEDLHLLPGSPAIDALPSDFPADADGSRAEIGALTYDPLYCGIDCDVDPGAVECVSGANSLGRVAELEALGSTEVATDRLLVAGSLMPPGSFGLLVAADAPGSIPVPGSASPLCLGAPLVRVDSSLEPVRPDGTVGMRLPLTTGPLAGIAAAGQTWHLQVWYRDAGAAGTTSNTSSSVSVTLR